MDLYENLAEYAGLPVIDFSPGDGRPPAGHAVRVRSEYAGATYAEAFEALLDETDTARLTALVVGYWDADHDVRGHPTDLLAEAADAFPNLRSVFLGDVTVAESEISWIGHVDITPLFTEFPALERLDVRGSGGLAFDPLAHGALRTLRFESGGLPPDVVRALGASDLPVLEHLDLWLGAEDYGGGVTAADLAPVLDGRFPALRRLGLENAENADELAAALAAAPIAARLESLSLALGALTDAGADALAAHAFPALRRLDLHHHFVGEAAAERLRAALPGAELDLTDRMAPAEIIGGVAGYIAVSE
ncbi:STM4015 family protein [Actinomadura atramentaria]|uniref:STM4015 family protein n=1 Tax=Actinomadura atramentaria TaxID=1990 RepID=UPI0003A7D677|nr:STM4015 family protein [Actinomadura atramentaria]